MCTLCIILLCKLRNTWDHDVSDEIFKKAHWLYWKQFQLWGQRELNHWQVLWRSEFSAFCLQVYKRLLADGPTLLVCKTKWAEPMQLLTLENKGIFCQSHIWLQLFLESWFSLKKEQSWELLFWYHLLWSIKLSINEAAEMRNRTSRKVKALILHGGNL